MEIAWVERIFNVPLRRIDAEDVSAARTSNGIGLPIAKSTVAGNFTPMRRFQTNCAAFPARTSERFGEIWHSSFG